MHINSSLAYTDIFGNIYLWLILWYIYYIAINLFFHHQSISVDVIYHLYLTHTIKLMTLVHSVHILSKINLKFCKYYIIFLKYGYFNEFNDGPAEAKCMKLPRWYEFRLCKYFTFLTWRLFLAFYMLFHFAICIVAL